jgi:hypothetical protein
MKLRNLRTIWPPLVWPEQLSVWVRLRDGLITFLAWVLMAWLIRHELSVLVDYFRPPVFQLTRVSTPNWAKFWDQFGGFVILSGVLVGWIVLWAIRRRRIVFRAPNAPEPAPLALEAHARVWDLSPETVLAARSSKSIRADFDETGRLISWT